VGGSGGAGGGAGGGAIVLTARMVDVAGTINANGAGQAALLAGYGAGGGILLKARQDLKVRGGALVTSLGGAGGGSPGVVGNGGTVKLHGPTASSIPVASVTAGLIVVQ
jgi:hypothetical protein